VRPYEKMVEALGGYGELVVKDEEIIPALQRGLRFGQAGLPQRAHRPHGDQPGHASLLPVPPDGVMRLTSRRE